MTEPTEKKGMSKGCLIGLIVAGVLLVMIIIAAVVIYIYKDDLAKFGANTVVATIQSEVANNPIPGIDSTAFADVCNAFSDKLANESVDAQKYQVFFQTISPIVSDKKVDSLEAVLFLEAIFEYYPELEDLYPSAEPDTTVEQDSLEIESE